MLRVRKGSERGRFDYGWLDTRHTFSFADYRDPAHMGFRSLRVINDDRIQPGGGFPMDGHRDMEIITYVLDGALQHRDSMGNGSVIRPGEVQRMTAGTGVMHSEFNASKTQVLRLLQIWILPERRGLAPGYEQKHFPVEEKRGRLRLVASRDGRDGSVTIRQDANVFASLLDAEGELAVAVDRKRGLWLQVARGEIEAGGQHLEEGDALAVTDEPGLEIRGVRPAELLLFELA